LYNHFADRDDIYELKDWWLNGIDLFEFIHWHKHLWNCLWELTEKVDCLCIGV